MEWKELCQEFGAWVLTDTSQFYTRFVKIKIETYSRDFNGFCVTEDITSTYSMRHHNSDVIISAMASQSGVSIVCSIVWSGTDQWKHQSYTPLAFVKGIHRWPVDSPHKGPVTSKMFLFDDVIMASFHVFV